MIAGVSSISIAAGPQVSSGGSGLVVTHKFQIESSSSEFDQMIDWVRQRQAESSNKRGIFSADKDYSSSVISVEILTRNLPQQNSPSTIGPGGVALPTTGSTGQRITITDCQAGQYKEQATYEWQPNSNGGGNWVRIDWSRHENNTISCPLE